MAYLLGKMVICLLLSGIFGAIIGWLFKHYAAIKHNNELLYSFEAERKLHQHDKMQVEASWQEKYSAVNKERHSAKMLLATQEKENLRLLGTVKTNRQTLSALEDNLDILKNKKLVLKNKLLVEQKQNEKLIVQNDLMKALPDNLRKISGIGEANEQVLNENGITSYAQIATFSEEDEKRCGNKLGAFASRVSREEWVKQAKLLHKEKYDEEI